MRTHAASVFALLAVLPACTSDPDPLDTSESSLIVMSGKMKHALPPSTNCDGWFPPAECSAIAVCVDADTTNMVPVEQEYCSGVTDTFTVVRQFNFVYSIEHNGKCLSGSIWDAGLARQLDWQPCQPATNDNRFDLVTVSGQAQPVRLRSRAPGGSGLCIGTASDTRTPGAELRWYPCATASWWSFN
jgi:hypothetical protein